MKTSFQQNKRTKDITVSFKIGYYDLRKLVQTMQFTSVTGIAVEFEEFLEKILNETDEPT